MLPLPLLRACRFLLASTAILLALGVLAPAFAVPTECDLSLQPGVADACPVGGAVGAASPNRSLQGATVDPKTDGRVAIDAFGYCRYVRNDGGEPLFVPFGSEEEWHAYQTNHPATAHLTNCTRGGPVIIPPNFGHDGASNQCVTLPPPQSVFAPYKPANVAGDFKAPLVTYSCGAADGTSFTETAAATLTAHDSGYGPNDDLGWSFSKILYTYDGQCGAARGVATPTAPTSGLCRVGVPSAVIGTGPFTWLCAGGTGGGKNASCSTGTTCETHKVEEKPCRCEDKLCFRPVYWSDSCGHTWIDKSQVCDKAEPLYAPQHVPTVDDTNN